MSAEFSEEVLDTVHDRSGFVCEVCGKKRATEHHHRRLRGKGSTKRAESASVSACLHTCHYCHRLVHAEPDLSDTCGWIVLQNESPASKKVVYRGREVLLDDDGLVHPVQDWRAA